jgi:hypothetical protein
MNVTRKLPSLFDLEKRVAQLEFDHGRITRELSELRTDMVQANKSRDELDSQADLSIRPGRAKLQLRRVPPWAVVAVIAIVSAAFTYAVTR